MPLVHPALSTLEQLHSAPKSYKGPLVNLKAKIIKSKEWLMLECALFLFQSTGAEAIKSDKGGAHEEYEERNLCAKCISEKLKVY